MLEKKNEEAVQATIVSALKGSEGISRALVEALSV